MVGMFGKRLEQLFKQKNITKIYIAKRLGLKRQNYIINITSGSHVPSLKRVEEIAGYLKCSREETRELINLALQERIPDEIKKYDTLLHSGPPILGTISNPFDILALTQSASSYPYHIIKLNECLIFEIKSDFFNPVIKNGQQILVLRVERPGQLRANDLLFIKFQCRDGNYEEAVRNFKKKNDNIKSITVVKSGSEHLFGIVKSYMDKSQIVIIGHKDPASRIEIVHKDITTMFRIVGILFDRLPKIPMEKFRRKK